MQYFVLVSKKIKLLCCRTVATLGASEGGACVQEGIMEGGSLLTPFRVPYWT